MKDGREVREGGREKGGRRGKVKREEGSEGGKRGRGGREGDEREK